MKIKKKNITINFTVEGTYALEGIRKKAQQISPVNSAPSYNEIVNHAIIKHALENEIVNAKDFDQLEEDK